MWQFTSPNAHDYKKILIRCKKTGRKHSRYAVELSQNWLNLLKVGRNSSNSSFIRNKSIIFAQTFKSNMRIVSHKALKEFYDKPGHEDAKVPLEHWYHTTENANWNNFAEMKADFGSVDNVGNQHYVFNIGGNKYRLIVVVKYVMGYVFIRFVGTHNEYDKIDASTI